MIGPENPFSQELHATKYRDVSESFDDYCIRYARATAKDKKHFRDLLDALRNQRLLPAGRQQLAVGRPHQITAFNCFVGMNIPDSTEGIMDACKFGALTMRQGGGVGWNFSTIRPTGEPVRGLGAGAYASGPVSYMNIWNAMCSTIMSANSRRNAMMGVLDVHHPDVMTFVNAKRNSFALTNFNISLAISREFMEAVKNDDLYELRWGGRVFDRVRALDVWLRVMDNNWSYAEPGVIYMDRVNEWNNLHYAETIACTNPCSEQPLPEHGCCLLGSINIAKLLVPTMKSIGNVLERSYEIDFDLLEQDVRSAVIAFDNVTDLSNYPLLEQRQEQMNKRRMGVGVCGMANALEVCGHVYGTDDYIEKQGEILAFIRDIAYQQSVELAKEKGPFPLFDAEQYAKSKFIQTLPDNIQHDIKKYGIRNSHLLSIAPTGTISTTADFVSGGIEPPYSLKMKRTVNMPQGPIEIDCNDYAYEKYGVKGRTAYEVTAEQHIRVLANAQAYVDSAVSKTTNVFGQIKGEGPGVTFDEFGKLYELAYDLNCKSCATFNINGERSGILKKADEEPSNNQEGMACYINPVTGTKTCE